jgi:RNA polymerase sigma-70 factor (ECF subfamily)
VIQLADVLGDDHARGRSSPSSGDPIQEVVSAAAPPDFNAVYRDHFDLVWRTLRRYGVLEASLDDAVQDVFLVVYTRLASFEGRSSLRTWLLGIARRVARDHRPSSRASAEPETLEVLPDVEERSPAATLEATEGARLLERVLATLTPEKREAFILVELEQMTAQEAGQALGVNANTISSRLRAARSELEQALARLDAHSEWRQRCAT